jgi:hypothetical protein
MAPPVLIGTQYMRRASTPKEGKVNMEKLLG